MSKKNIWKKYLSFLFVLTCVSAVILPVISSDAYDNIPFQPTSTGNDWWSMFRHDRNHSGFSTTTGPENNQMLWSYQTNNTISSSPAVSHGRVYVGSWDWNLYCFEMDSGNLLWSYSTNGEITSSPAIVNGKIYVGSQDKKLYCLNAIDGTYLWDFETDFIVDTSPVIINDSVFFGSSDGSLYCLNREDGSLLWNYHTGSVIVSSPIVSDGKAYFGATNGNFFCLDSNTGDLLWKYIMTDGVYSSPVISDGNIYFGANDHNVYCLDADDGSLIWNYSTFSEIHSTPAIAYNYLYVGTNNGRLLCLQKNTGDFVWNYQITGSIKSSPSLADDKVYFGTDPCCGYLSYFYCLNAFTGEKIWEYNFNTQFGMKSSPALAASKVFVSSGDGKVYAFGDIEFLADANGPYYSILNTPVNFIGSVFGGQPGFSWFWDFGDNTTSTKQNPTHTYTSLGEYPVTLTVTDNTGEAVMDETSIFIELPNSSPEKPVIDGPTTGTPSQAYEYTVNSSDVDYDNIRYYIDWGDNTTTGWIGPFQSGIGIIQEHTWSEKGVYIVKAKAKDSHGAESNWSDAFKVNIAVPELAIDINGGFGVSVAITNLGDAPATNVSWNITIIGGLVYPAYDYGIIPMIFADNGTQIRISLFGFGKKTILVSVLSDDGRIYKKSANVLLLLLFVIGVK